MKIVLIAMDTTRWDHLSCYGYFRKTTPNIDRLAAKGALFLNSYPTDVPTQPCYTSIFTGKRGITTGVVTHGQPEQTITCATFPQILAENGFLTAGISTLYRFRRWFAKGFTHYLQPKMKTWLQHVVAPDINELALPWLEAYHKNDFFLFLHYWDPHQPYTQAPKEYLAKFYQEDLYCPNNRSLEFVKENPLFYQCLRHLMLIGDITDINGLLALYDSEINYADEYIGEIINTLEKLKILEETMIIITSDHGEAFGEHGHFDHMDAHEPVIHVPLIIYYPPKIKPQEISGLVQHIDFAPTFLESFGVKVPKDMEGKSLWPLLEGERETNYEKVFTNQGLWEAQRAMLDERYKLIKTIDRGFFPLEPKTELYDLQNDPREENNIAEQEKEIVKEMEYHYFKWLEGKLKRKPDPLRVWAQKGLATKELIPILRQKLEEQKVEIPSRAEIDTNLNNQS